MINRPHCGGLYNFDNVKYVENLGNPNDPNSLHAGGKFNEYEMAIKAIGDILAYYDSDKLFPGMLLLLKFNHEFIHLSIIFDSIWFWS